MSKYIAQKNIKYISLETKLELIKKHSNQKVTTTLLTKEYGTSTSTISTRFFPQRQKNQKCPYFFNRVMTERSSIQRAGEFSPDLLVISRFDCTNTF
ncbi:hypothetical protein BpHYR1_023519 [Brachionus plicatilis]|uniref:HTH psq-type domain-containing protein n=1 Tax=Brachionus plicatilis TaxID=10195 RepID=A0A3M7P7Q0_BRAPC|nr:hypothetical protein BpHYR1_023519 [Brachionus plicatilis]